jgi:hypothetical protein
VQSAKVFLKGPDMAMKRVKIADLKNQLSQHLRAAESTVGRTRAGYRQCPGWIPVALARGPRNNDRRIGNRKERPQPPRAEKRGQAPDLTPLLRRSRQL